MLACGHWHTVCLSDCGDVWCFGCNKRGQIGAGIETKLPYSSPFRITGLPRIIEVSCGSCFTMLVDSDGFIWGLGDNNKGQLGFIDKRKSKRHHPTPVLVDSLPNIAFRSVACGGNHTLCISEKNEVWGFGSNKKGQLGLGYYKTRVLPQRVPGVVNIQQASAGLEFSYLIDLAGNAYAAGSNSTGQLFSTRANKQNLFHFVTELENNPITEIKCGEYHAMFLGRDGSVWTSGLRRAAGSGQVYSSIYKVILPKVISINCGKFNSFAIDEEHRVFIYPNSELKISACDYSREYGWGQKIKLQNILETCGGLGHIIIKDKDSTFWVWGDNQHGCLGLGEFHETQVVSVPTPLADSSFTSEFMQHKQNAKSARK